jgi:aspartate racemase
MKTIGLIGGMSWESTVTYYQIVNEVTKKELGGLHSAKCILYSVDFQEIEVLQASGEWKRSGYHSGLYRNRSAGSTVRYEYPSV